MSEPETPLHAEGDLTDARSFAAAGELERSDSLLLGLVELGGRVETEARRQLIDNAAARQRRWDQVAQLCTDFLADNPGDVAVLRIHGRALSYLGDGEAAVRVLHTALAHDPGSDTTRYELVAAQLGSADGSGAVQTLAGFTDESAATAVKSAALVALARHDPTGAEARLRGLARVRGWDAEIANNLAVAYSMMRRPARAAAMMRKAIRTAAYARPVAWDVLWGNFRVLQEASELPNPELVAIPTNAAVACSLR